MKRIPLLVALALFALLISAPILWQSWKERGTPEGPRILHLFTDTFRTPLERRNDLSDRLDSVLVQLDSLRVSLASGTKTVVVEDFTLPDLEDTTALWPETPPLAGADPAFWEALAAQGTALAQRSLQIDRYHTIDSTAPEAAPYFAYAQLLQAAYDRVIQGEPHTLVSIDSLRAQTEILHTRTKAVSNWQLLLDALLHRTVFDATYLRAWEHDQEKASYFGEFLRARTQVSLYKAFGDLGEKGVAGKQDWSFYRPGIEYRVRPAGSEKGDDPAQCIIRFRDQLNTLGIDLLVVVVPNKETIYPDRLVSHIGNALPGRSAHAQALLATLQQHQVKTVDLFAPLAKARQASSASNLYLANDTHWSPQGMEIAARTVATAIRQNAALAAPETPHEYALQDTLVERRGDILDMSRLPTLGVAFAPETAHTRQVYEIERDSSGAEIGRTLYKDALRDARILLLGDSFSRIYQTDAPRSAGFAAHLAAQLGEPLATLVSDGGASTLVRQKLARKPALLRKKRLVVWEFVERDLRYGAEGWQEVALATLK